MDETLLRERYTQIMTDLASASEGRYAPPMLIAVTKTHPAEDILPLAKLGVTEIGENRVQEMLEKWPALQEKFHLHCIGRLQSNKVKYIINDVCLIQSVDRLSLAQEIDRQAQMHGRVMPVLVQLSPAGEKQKGGLPPEELLPFLETLRHMPGLQVKGLMAVMPNTQDTAYLEQKFADMRRCFEQTRDLALQGVAMEELSMGMSGDCMLAAKHGATMVRIGSRLMGPRPYPNDRG